MALRKDRLNNFQRKEVAESTFLLLTRLQDHPSDTQIASACAMFLLLCEEFKIEPQDVFVAVKNALARPREIDGEDCFRAVRLYITHELNK